MIINDYKQIQELREAITEELLTSGAFPSVTIDMLKLVEARIQTIIMAGLDEKEVKQFSKKRNG